MLPYSYLRSFTGALPIAFSKAQNDRYLAEERLREKVTKTSDIQTLSQKIFAATDHPAFTKFLGDWHAFGKIIHDENTFLLWSEIPRIISSGLVNFDFNEPPVTKKKKIDPILDQMLLKELNSKLSACKTSLPASMEWGVLSRADFGNPELNFQLDFCLFIPSANDQLDILSRKCEIISETEDGILEPLPDGIISYPSNAAINMASYHYRLKHYQEEEENVSLDSITDLLSHPIPISEDDAHFRAFNESIVVPQSVHADILRFREVIIDGVTVHSFPLLEQEHKEIEADVKKQFKEDLPKHIDSAQIETDREIIAGIYRTLFGITSSHSLSQAILILLTQGVHQRLIRRLQQKFSHKEFNIHVKSGISRAVVSSKIEGNKLCVKVIFQHSYQLMQYEDQESRRLAIIQGIRTYRIEKALNNEKFSITEVTDTSKLEVEAPHQQQAIHQEVLEPNSHH